MLQRVKISSVLSSFKRLSVSMPVWEQPTEMSKCKRLYGSRSGGAVPGLGDFSEEFHDSQDDGEGPLGPAATKQRLRKQAKESKDIQILHPLHGIFCNNKKPALEFSPFLSAVFLSSVLPNASPSSEAEKIGKSRVKNSSPKKEPNAKALKSKSATVSGAKNISPSSKAESASAFSSRENADADMSKTAHRKRGRTPRAR